jgi:hypothetical protein
MTRDDKQRKSEKIHFLSTPIFSPEALADEIPARQIPLSPWFTNDAIAPVAG